MKMIVMDLDGTLLNANGKVSEKSKCFLKELKESGYIIVIATGRIYISALEVTDGAHFANYILSDTGACCYDVENGNILFESNLPDKAVEKIFSYYDDSVAFIDICDQNTIYKYSDFFYNDKKYIKTIKDKDYILNNCKKVSHASIMLKEGSFVFELYDRLIKELANVNVVFMQDSFSSKKWIEVLPENCSKYSAICRLLSILKINNKDVFAFGDGLNDLEMIKHCKNGIAMKNALKEIKEVASDVTKYSNIEDGVIQYIEENLIKNKK